MKDRKCGSMRLHAAALSTLAERPVKDEFGVTELGSQSLGTSIQFTVEDQAAAGAVFDRNDHGILQPFCHPEPVFGQGDKVGIVFDEDRNFKLSLEQFAKIDVGDGQNRTPECDAPVRINK